MAQDTKLPKRLGSRPFAQPPLHAPASRAFARGSGMGSDGGTEVGRFHNYRGVIFLALTVLVLWLNLSFLKPLVMGAIFAVVLYPLMERTSHWKIGRIWRAGLITIAFTVTFLVPIAVLVILGADAAIEKLQSLENAGFTGGRFFPSAIADMLGLRPLIEKLAAISPVSEAQVRQYTTRAIVTAGAILGKALQGMLANLPGVIFANIIILFTLFFLLIDGKRAVAFAKQNSIFGPHQTDRIFENAAQLCYSVIVATIVSGVTQSALIGLSCLITGTEGVVLIVLIAFIMSFFPVIGTAPVTVFLTAQAFLQGDVRSGFIFLVFIGIVGISDNIVRPYVLKGGAELHPLVGFVAAFGALDAIGFYGLFIGPVVAGLFFTLLPMVTRSYPRSPKPELR